MELAGRAIFFGVAEATAGRLPGGARGAEYLAVPVTRPRRVRIRAKMMICQRQIEIGARKYTFNRNSIFTLPFGKVCSQFVLGPRVGLLE